MEFPRFAAELTSKVPQHPRFYFAEFQNDCKKIRNGAWNGIIRGGKCIKGSTHYLGNKQEFDVSSGISRGGWGKAHVLLYT